MDEERPPGIPLPMVHAGAGGPAKTCERCGESFRCGAGAPACWCKQVVVSGWARRQIVTTYFDCLCPACLGDFAAAGAEHVRGRPG